MEQLITWIYALRDPRDNSIRYVGQSVNPKQRLVQHRADARRGRDMNTRKEQWLEELRENNLRPTLEIIERYEGPKKDAYIREWEIISALLAEGHPLTNGNDGGVPYIIDDDRVKTVYQYSKDGGFIAEYRCAFDAFSLTGVKDSNIGRACRDEGRRYRYPGGFIWSYNRYERFPVHIIPPRVISRARAVRVVDRKTGITKNYCTARAASKATNVHFGLISCYCLGQIRNSRKHPDYSFSFAQGSV